MAAESIAAHEALREGLRVALLLRLPTCDVPVVRTDNRPATNVMETGYSQKLVPYERAIGMRVGLFRDCILSGIVIQDWVPSSQNAADALTKRLGPLPCEGRRVQDRQSALQQRCTCPDQDLHLTRHRNLPCATLLNKYHRAKTCVF